MEITEKVMAACLFLSEVDDEAAVMEFIYALETGVSSSEADALVLLSSIRKRLEAGPLPVGVLGDVILVMKSKQRLDRLYDQMLMTTSKLKTISGLLSGRVESNLQAKIMVKKVENVLYHCLETSRPAKMA
jgi:hypothetical protein